MESMEQIKPSTETGPPLSLRDFVVATESREKKARLKNRELLSDTAMKEVFARKLREGNFSDFFERDVDRKIHIAEHLEEELFKGMRDKENYRQEKIIAKLVAFYKKQKDLFLLYIEAKDDEKLQELASVMETEMPFLKEIHEKYMKEFSDDTLEG